MMMTITVIRKVGFRLRTLGVIGLVSLMTIAPHLLFAQQTQSDLQASLAMHNKIQQDGAVAEELKQVIELDLINASIEQALNDIAQKTDLKLMYSRALLPQEKKVTLDSTNITLYSALWKVLDGTGLRFGLSQNRQLVLLKMQEPESSSVVQETIIGTVTDAQSGETLPGVNVMVKGTTTGTSTDSEGTFELTVESLQDTLIFSFVGYQTQEISINGRTEIEIALQPQAIAGEELVVVGYGTQKEVDLTAAIEQVDVEKINDRPVGNLGQALQGASAGLNVFTNSSGGQPDATMDFNIRGLGSPYVLVDGLPVDINHVNPQDIESVEVIKGASAAAIYGASAPYGVVLITTKQGGTQDGEPRLSYSNTLTMGTPTNLPTPLNSLEFANITNDAAINAGDSPYFTDEVMGRIRQYLDDPNSIPATTPDPSDPSRWGFWEKSNGNTNWFDELLKPWAFRQKHDVSLSGGGDNTSYYLSTGYFEHQGQFRYMDEEYKRYNIDAKIRSEVTNWLNVDFLTKYSRDNTNYPSDQYDLERNVLWHDLYRRYPTDPLKYPNGGWSEMSRIKLYQESGREKEVSNDLWAKLGVEIEPIKGWQIIGDYGWNYSNYEYSNHRSQVYTIGPDGDRYLHFDSVPVNELNKRFTTETYWNANIYSSFERSISNHFFKILVGYQRESNSVESISGIRDNLITDNVPSFSTATGSTTLDDDFTEWTTSGVFSRINYNYKEKYLIEFNGRYQGSSFFEEGSRFGLFPSVSIGYRISEERFWDPIEQHINNFKIRASYGSLGNHNVSRYLYLPTMPIQSQVSWLDGNDPVVGVYAPSIISPSLTWETINSIDFGIDVSVLNDRLDMTFDYFIRTVTDMFGNASPRPSVLGTSLPQVNNASQENKGWELSLGWNDQIGNDLSYNVELGVSDYKTVITKWNNPDKFLTQNYVGKTVGEIWGYTSNGLFQSDDEIANSADQSRFHANWDPGDVKYEDINGDGSIGPGQNTVEDHGDLKIIGNSQPRYLYNFHINMAYKGFDFSMLWNGIGKKDAWFDSPVYWGFGGHRSQLFLFEEHLDYYKEGNEDAFYPRPYMRGGGISKNRQISTRYLENGAYLRLKNLQIGYTLPEQIISKLSASRIRLFFNGENLLTFSKLPDFFDPEGLAGTFGQGKVYPLQTTLSLGVNINF